MGAPWRGPPSAENHEAVDSVVADFIQLLSHWTRYDLVASIPIRRDVHHRPLYSLVLASRHRRAEWHLGDVTAKCLDEFRQAADARAGRLEPSPRRQELEDAALADIEANLLALVDQLGVALPVGDYAGHMFGDHWALVGERVVRRAIKSLHAQGLTPSTGVGGKVEDLLIAPNP